MIEPTSEKKRKSKKFQSATFKAPAVANVPWNTIRNGSLKYFFWKNAAINSFYPSCHYDNVIEKMHIVR
jgi:hypothetical protein